MVTLNLKELRRGYERDVLAELLDALRPDVGECSGRLSLAEVRDKIREFAKNRLLEDLGGAR